MIVLAQWVEIDGNRATFRGCAWEWTTPDRPAPGPVFIFAERVTPSACGPGPDWIAPDGASASTYYGAARRFHAWTGEWECKVLPVGVRWSIACGADQRCPPGAAPVLVLDLTCAADWNHDGAVTVDDLQAFLAAYEAGGADLDDGAGRGAPDGGTDVNDLLFFLAHYAGGC